MLYNSPKSVIDAITKVVADDRIKYNQERDTIESKLQLEAMKKMKFEYVVPEDIEKEGVAHFMGAAAAAHKAGQKKFSFGGKTYPVQIKPHIAHQVAKEEVEQIDELSTDTLKSYHIKAYKDMKDKGEKLGMRPGTKKDWKRIHGMETAKSRLYSKGVDPYAKATTKEEVDIDETKGAPKGFHFTRDGKLKRGDADRDGDGGKMLRSDPLDKQRNKIPQVSEVEQVDELSKDTLKSYVGKVIDKTRTMPQGEKKQKHLTGFGKAMDKMKKESSDTPGNSTHQCAIHVKHEQFGEGKTIYTQHAEPAEDGSIEWYDVMFEHGIEKAVKTSDMEIVVSEAHMNHKGKKLKEDTELDEARGRPRKNPNAAVLKKSDDEDDDDYGPDTGPEPDQNIVNHLKKSVDTGGTHDVKFGDNSSHKVPSHVAHKVLGAMGKLKPADRLEIQKHVGQSHKNLMDVHRMIK